MSQAVGVADDDTPVIELRGVTKRFPGVVANDDVSLRVHRSETLGLLGENGAGKSVLMGVLYGHHRADEGGILVDGRPVAFATPHDAIAHGIGMVHQHFMLVPPLSVLDNIILGAEPMAPMGRIDRRAARVAIGDLADRYRLDVDLDRRVEDIPVGMAQRVEILKAIYRGANVLVLDEPTAVLTPPEVDGLHRILGALRREGIPSIFITHKLHEVLSFCDRVVVMRRGRVVEEARTDQSTRESLARAMVGRPVVLRVDKPTSSPGQPALELRDVSTAIGGGDRDLDGIDLTVRRGEIVAVAGVAGNGQSSLVAAVSGVAPTAQGGIRLGGVDVTRRPRAGRLRAGMSVIPEDRLREGVIPAFPVYENAILGDHDQPRFGTRLRRDLRAVRAHARELVATFDVRCADERVPVGALSGGNQQKLVCARELARDPVVLVAAQPTRGVDVGAIELIHNELVRRRDLGTGVLLVSTELDEVLSLADRIVVMSGGRIVAELDGETATAEEIGVHLAGASDVPPPAGSGEGGGGDD